MRGAFLQKPLDATFADLSCCSPSAPPTTTHTPPPSTTNDTNCNSYQSIITTECNKHPTTTTNTPLPPHLRLLDLLAIGTGGTIGSGIFVLCGHVAHTYAGPATSLCWILSGLAACLSGVCYAELACRLPAAGSSYVYVYASMGEWPAVVVSGCLTLAYLVSGSAVARSWGEKMVLWLEDIGVSNAGAGDGGVMGGWAEALGSWGGINWYAAFVSLVSVLLLMKGMRESTAVANFFTLTKVLLVAFMGIVGVSLAQSRNLTPFVPPEFGYAGVLRGTTSCFFGYVGFDELACLSQQTIHPQRNVPLGIVYTLGIVASLYVLAALALTGMSPYEEISDVSGFPVAFRANGLDWAAQITAFGEVFTLPIVVLISIMAQPQLQYALAVDGLLPEVFRRVDEQGNLWHGTVIAGVLMVVIAALVPFVCLNDAISAGILLAFTMTDASLVIMRYDSPVEDDGLVERLLSWFNVVSFGFGLASTHFIENMVGKIVAVLCAYKALSCVVRLRLECTPVLMFGGRNRKGAMMDMRMDGNAYFKTPFMPYVPLLGTFVNWYLIAQLELIGIVYLVGFLAVISIFYFSYGRRHSVGNNGGWEQQETINGSDSERTSLT